MDEGYIVLVNTEPKDQSDEAATLFTRLMVKSFFMAAKQRPKADETPPFFLVIDEASRYLTKDTAGILAQTAGYGLYLIAGMQGLEQARLEDEASYLALRENVGGEVVMRLLDHEEKIYWARRFFGDHLDFTKVKYEELSPGAIPYLTKDEKGRYVDYEPTEKRAVFFYTADELERMEARKFGLRNEGEAQRFGMVRVNERTPTKIEIPELDPVAYKPEEMLDWLRKFKATQPATLPLIEAQRRFDALRTHHVQLLTQDTRTISLDHEPPATRQLKPGATATLTPASRGPKPSPGKKRQEKPS
jgi:hypothetical protein